MTEITCRDCAPDLHGYLDNELDTARGLAIHRHLQSCKACQLRLEEMKQLQQAVRDHATYYEAPQQLADKIRAAATKQSRTTKPVFFWNFDLRTKLFPAFSFAALACAVLLYLATPAAENDWADEAISDHVRSLMAQHITDVASSDRHTVKPWFIGKLDFAPPTYDFTAQGFPLTGGRLDYLQKQTVAALVYTHNKHVINLFVLPASGADSLDAQHIQKRGYNLAVWQQNHLQFIAVSDMDAAGLNALSKLIQGAAAAP